MTSPQVWATRLDVEAVLVAYQAALDERRFADAGACFADDGVLAFGDVRIVGPASVAAATERQLGVLDLTHHTAINARVTVDGTTARLSAQAIGAHVWHEDGEPKQSVLGGHYEAALRLTDDGWRLALLAPSFLWTVGDPWEH